MSNVKNLKFFKKMSKNRKNFFFSKNQNFIKIFFFFSLKKSASLLVLPWAQGFKQV